MLEFSFQLKRSLFTYANVKVNVPATILGILNRILYLNLVILNFKQFVSLKKYHLLNSFPTFFQSQYINVQSISVVY